MVSSPLRKKVLAAVVVVVFAVLVKKYPPVLALALAILLKRWIYRKAALTHNPTSPLAKHLVDSIPALKSYMPTPYLITGTVQTMVCIIFGMSKDDNAPKLFKCRDVLPMPECKRPPQATCCPAIIPEGVVSVEWVVPDSEKDFKTSTTPVMVLVPGLSGSSDDDYIRTVASKVCANGFRVACYTPRGNGQNKLLTPFTYAAGFTHDLRRAITEIRRKVHPDVQLIGAGFSLGANVLTMLMGQDGDDCELDAAMSVANPLDIITTVVSLRNRWIGKYVFDGGLTFGIKGMFKKFQDHFPDYKGPLNVPHILEAWTMSDFDHRASAPMCEFECVSDYYRGGSSSLKLSNIRRPTLFIHGNNDPMIPGNLIRMDNFETNPYLLFAMTNSGGHSMTWPTGMGQDTWVGQVLVEFTNAVTHHAFDTHATSVKQDMEKAHAERHVKRHAYVSGKHLDTTSSSDETDSVSSTGSQSA